MDGANAVAGIRLNGGAVKEVGSLPGYRRTVGDEEHGDGFLVAWCGGKVISRDLRRHLLRRLEAALG